MAILGSVGAAVHSRDMADAQPAGVPQADAVRETLGGPTTVAAHLPAETAQRVLTAARDAFTHGMGYAAIGAATVMAVAAFFSFARLRGAGSSEAPGEPHSVTEPAGPVGGAHRGLRVAPGQNGGHGTWPQVP
ncbi:hypothetical protein ACWGII_10045 [Streptomyces sp. NPDC054855]